MVTSSTSRGLNCRIDETVDMVQTEEQTAQDLHTVRWTRPRRKQRSNLTCLKCELNQKHVSGRGLALAGMTMSNPIKMFVKFSKLLAVLDVLHEIIQHSRPQLLKSLRACTCAQQHCALTRTSACKNRTEKQEWRAITAGREGVLADLARDEHDPSAFVDFRQKQ